MAPDTFHLSEGGSAAPKHKPTQVKVDGIDYSSFLTEGAALATSAKVDEDGRIIFSLSEKVPLPELPEKPVSLPEFGVDSSRPLKVPALSILITVVGSRGDVQPFIPIAHGLQKAGHRVRLGTHATFKDFVVGEGIEFYEIGGDPADLMSYMVKNPGLLPGVDSLLNGDIPRKRKMIGEILEGCWRATFEPDPISEEPFAADALISNPPCFAHIHVAEALNIPLHIIFTMPWISTQAFPHPLVNVSQSNAKPGMTNYLSYVLVDLLAWQGLGDVINSFRNSSLGLKPLSLRSGPLILERLRIPTSFCWSPTLIPKPQDWADHIDVTGFTFLESGPSFQPEAELQAFLDEGDAPIYIGFGSVPVEDAKAMTKILFSAVEQSGVRALISPGWAKLGEGAKVPDNVFLVGNVPHDWLFKSIKAAVHHGGAGTTAIAVKEGRPSLVVPFFGDQPFWGEMIAKAGAGPQPIPPKDLTAETLAEALKFLVKPETLKAAQKLGEQIREEDGVKLGLSSFEEHLPLLNMRCDLDPAHAACWWSPAEYVKLSPFAAQVLSDAGKLDLAKLRPHRVKNYATRADITDPITGGGFAIFRTVLDYYSGLGQILTHPVKGITNTVTAIPLGICNIVASTGEGIRNLPKAWGGEVRPVGEITDFESGVKEAGKGFYFGYQDAIADVFVQPYKGAKAEGGMGFIKGAARGIGNAMLKPAAGGLGLVEHSGRGIWASLTKKLGPQAERVHRQASTRKGQGLAAVETSSTEQRSAVLARWDELTRSTSERKAKMEKEVADWQQEMDEAGLGEVQENIVEGEAEKGGVEVKAEAGAEQPGVGGEQEGESAEAAAERRGYERAKAELAAAQKDA